MSLMDGINSLQKSIVNAADDIAQRFDSGLLSIIVWIMSKVAALLMLAWIKTAIFVIGFSWSFAKSLIVDIGLIPSINNALASISPGAAGILQVFGFTEALNIILAALVARFIFRFIPGFH